MDKVTAIFKSKWFLHAVGLTALFLIIWFVGPLLAIADHYVLETVSSRLLFILIILFIYAAIQVWRYVISKNKNEKMMSEMAVDPLAVSMDEERGIIEDRFKEAIEVLKNSPTKGNQKTFLYELPWYIIIGPPGAGKTTALLNSGLEFPLADKLGTDAIKGFGGTKHCDWWFTNKAVLIDTAGRFITQDSHESVDRSGWIRFMEMLKRYRKQRPINGVLIAVSISDLLTWNEDEAEFNAKTIRKRIEELTQHLNIKFPIYFMFTKCDLISGFSEFFSDLDEQNRAQVWGDTFGINDSNNSDFEISRYATLYDEMVERLKKQVIPKVYHQTDPLKKPQIIGFPSQISSLKSPILMLLESIFSDNRYQQKHLLRGVYFTSGTQEGTPFDRLLGSMAERMGFNKTNNLVFAGRGKSYFVRRLLSNVVFEEAELVGVDKNFTKIMRRLQYLSYFAAATLVIGISIIWTSSYFDNTQRIEQYHQEISNVEDELYSEPSMRGVRYKEILPELNQARDTMFLHTDKTFADHFGLDQKEEIHQEMQFLYHDSLKTKLLPVTGARLGELLINILNDGDTSLLYDVLKAYLMYAGVNKRSDVEGESEWLFSLLEADWRNMFPGEPEVVEQLKNHHKALFNAPHSPFKPDEKIVSAARQKLVQLPISQQVYLNVKQDLLSDHTKDLRFRDIAGVAGSEVFSSRSNKALDELVIPGLFTKDGMYQDFIVKSAKKAAEYLDNNWVLGEHNRFKGQTDIAQIQKDMYTYYFRDYVKVWSDLLKDLRIKIGQEQRQKVFILEQATALNGPIENLIYVVSRETDLGNPIGKVDTQAVSENVGIVSDTAQRVVSKANRLVRVSGKNGAFNKLGESVTQQFQKFHLLTSSNRGEPAVTALVERGLKFSNAINQTLFESFSDSPAFDVVNNRLKSVGRDPFSSLRANQNTLPEPVKEWLNSLSDIGWSLLLQKARQEINLIWKNDVVHFYELAIEERYPLSANASVEVELADFIEFFRTNGRLDGFLTRYLEPFINYRSSEWEQKRVDEQLLGLSKETISNLQQLKRISTLFFGRNAAEPKLSFSFKPISLGGNVEKVTLAFGNKVITYSHGPRFPHDISWPFDGGFDNARISFYSINGETSDAAEEGPWALFKIMQRYQLTQTNNNSVFNVMFSQQGMEGAFEMRVHSEFNPVGTKLLQRIKLPKEL